MTLIILFISYEKPSIGKIVRKRRETEKEEVIGRELEEKNSKW